MCSRTRGRQKDHEQHKQLKRRQAARRRIEERLIKKEYEL